MQRALLFALAVSILFLAGCTTPDTRIRQQPELFATLDADTQQQIRRGEIDLGYTPAMVRLALGEPTERVEATPGDSENSVWTYRNFHRDRKDIVGGGYRRRIVFDPVLRAETVIVEPIDDRLAAKLAPQSLRVVFRDGRVAAIERFAEI